jgi:hypothetical protein
MRDIRSFIPLVIICTILLGSACVPTTPEPTPTATPCPPIPLIAPSVFSPNGEMVSSLQPTFQWFYEAPCGPDEFGLEIAPDGNFAGPGVISEQTSGPVTTWTLTQTLQPASVYQWRVYAKRGFTSGPYSPAPWFWTGPICNASIPDIPELVSPIHGVVINEASPPLDWDFPAVGCLAERFQFEVSAQPDFMHTVLSGEGSGAWTSFETNVDFLQDCTDYYWRVAVLTGNQLGAFSSIGEFTTDFAGTCPTVAPAQHIYAIGCIGSQSMMISFEFSSPPEGTYEARSGGNTYECLPNEERPRLLHCTGPRLEASEEGLVELVEIESQEVVFTGQEMYPDCDQPSCIGLSWQDCTTRSDCKWIPGLSGFAAGFCTNN